MSFDLKDQWATVTDHPQTRDLLVQLKVTAPISATDNDVLAVINSGLNLLTTRQPGLALWSVTAAEITGGRFRRFRFRLSGRRGTL